MATPQPVTANGTGTIVEPHDGGLVHRGSASIRLSGGSVLGAWLGSIAVHIALFAAMLALVVPFSLETKTPEGPVARVELVGSVDAGAFTPTKIADLPTQSEQVAMETPPVPPPDRFAPPADLTTAKKPDLTIVGLGVGGGDADRFGLKIGGATAPQFFGLGTTAQAARTVVYVVDMSGSMLDTFHFVRAELRRSISSLRRSQKFHVIFFNSMTPLENSPRKLVSAIDAQKEQFFDFLTGITPNGGTQPSEAMHWALNLDPDLIYLLSDGQDFPASLPGELDGWNKNRRVRISTIAYLNPLGRRMLEAIAREHQGEFKFVSEDELP